VVVGDSDVDVQTAINAQMQVIGVGWGYREVELLRETGALNIAESPFDIIKIIDNFNQ
jgi:phosphoglycolate phosphatase